jgi:hypothetical protein
MMYFQIGTDTAAVAESIASDATAVACLFEEIGENLGGEQLYDDWTERFTAEIGHRGRWLIRALAAALEAEGGDHGA